MDPVSLISAIVGLGQLGVGIYDSWKGSQQNPYLETQTPTNINPWSDQVYGQLQSQFGNLNNQFQSALAQSQTAGLGDMDQGRGYLSQLANLQYDPMASQRAFMSQVPGFQNLVRNSIGDGTTENELQRLRTQAGEDAASRFGGSPTSAAFQQSVMRATAEPGFQYAQNREAMQSQMLNSLLGQTMGNINQSHQFGHSAQAQGLGQAAQGHMGLASMLQQGALGRSGQLAGLLGQTQGQLGQFGAPTMWSPNLIANPAYMSPGDTMSNMLGATALMNQAGTFDKSNWEWLTSLFGGGD